MAAQSDTARFNYRQKRVFLELAYPAARLAWAPVRHLGRIFFAGN